MKIKKKVIANLNKCYSIAPLTYNGTDYFLVAAEKEDPCLLFDMEGRQKDIVWEKPGGVMSMVQVPGSNGVFLATHKFYSPNDSKDAEIVVASPKEHGGWDIRTLVRLPHVHRFDIVLRNGVKYLIACTLKSGHEFRDDWSCAGKVYAAVLPDDLSQYSGENQLKLDVIKDEMPKNHGYYKIMEDGVYSCLISCEKGVYVFTPPEQGEKWGIRQLINEPASDAVLVDLDGDGEKELIVNSPFHGNNIEFYKKIENEYKKIYNYGEADFAHAIYGGTFMGEKAVVIGHRQGERDLLAFMWDDQHKRYKTEIIDHNCGPANVFKFEYNGAEVMISTNREIDEIAMYTFEK